MIPLFSHYEELLVNTESKPPFSLRYRFICYKGRLLIGANNKLKIRLLHQCHNSAVGGHSRIRSTYERAKQHFYMLDMKNQVTQYVQCCDIFQHCKAENVPLLRLLQPPPIPSKAWTHVSMNFIDQLPKAKTPYWWS